MHRQVIETNLSFVKTCIDDYDWNSLKNIVSVEELYDKFSDTINGIYNIYCPMKKIKVKRLDSLKPYISNEIKNLIKEKRKLQKKYNKTPIK